MDVRSKLLKTIHTGVDIGNTFYNNLHAETRMLTHYRHDELRLLAPKYFIELLQQSSRRNNAAASLDPDGMFDFMGIPMIPGPYEKIILYHVDYPLFKREDMIHEFDLSLFTETH